MSTKNTKTKATKSERVKALRDEGLSHIEAEIQIAQEDAEAKIAALKERQALEEHLESCPECRAVRELMLTILEEKHPDEFENLRAQAVHRREADAKARSTRIKGSRQSTPQHPRQPGHDPSNVQHGSAL